MTSRKLPTKAELDAAYQAIEDIHAKHLKVHGVALPARGTHKSIWLAMLHHHDRAVHKDEISEAVQREHPDAGKDQQVRHLKRDGWNIVSEKRGYHHLKDPTRPSQEFHNEQNRRRGRLLAKDFDELKRAFGNRCATCGAWEGEPDPRYGSDKVILQQGHQNPNRPSNEMTNIIPQCQFCNRSYRGDFVFDDKGRVYAVADTTPVKRASKEVQREILDYLKRTLENS